MRLLSLRSWVMKKKSRVLLCSYKILKIRGERLGKICQRKKATEAPANERVEQAVEEIMRLSENTGNEITLAEIGEHLSRIKLNKDQIDEV